MILRRPPQAVHSLMSEENTRLTSIMVASPDHIWSLNPTFSVTSTNSPLSIR